MQLQIDVMTLAQKTSDNPSPPKARTAHEARAIHGVEWSDEYAWLKAENWREVLRDPEKLPGPIRRHIEAENAYSARVLQPVKALRRGLVREMRARLKEDDSEAPQSDGPYAYYTRYRHGGQHKIYCRTPRDGGKETILLDGDARA
ncbi:MAG TPA: S9 family peptidase, partial [Roseiarcus sp.]|nr:S9 family peptidase [Roseiarcus sp.]